MSDGEGFQINLQMVWWLLVRGLILTLVVIFMFQIQSSPYRVHENVGEELIQLYDLRFLYSENCLAFKDNTRIYPGIIDFKKFNDEFLSDCVLREGFSSKLTIKMNDTELIAYNNKDNYIVDGRLCFSSRYKCNYNEFFILVKDEQGNIHDGLMKVNSVMKVG